MDNDTEHVREYGKTDMEKTLHFRKSRIPPPIQMHWMSKCIGYPNDLDEKVHNKQERTHNHGKDF